MKIKMLRLIVMAVLLSTILPAGAVLKESSFEQTLTVLKAELERSYHKQKTIMALYEQRTKDEHEQLIVTMRQPDFAYSLFAERGFHLRHGLCMPTGYRHV